MLCTIFYSLVESYQKTHSFAALTRSFSDTTKSYARIFHGVISIYSYITYIKYILLVVKHLYAFFTAGHKKLKLTTCIFVYFTLKAILVVPD